ncbi:LON peptidase substrate-binding domain-containing protein [Varunaivibrio sulfuroxidans]|uniref:Lon N-terminal domain-containing protein n=1 Tax=Varunaivibrio sulfuroxidans TaxID=1773489 RepID=A0A4V2UP74_9PROT|nr:LON peptidase substrate-binding domain-containing protein [Varunaivibrio sulfuroxidans]TCS64831.1 hypothetical protein EDD55_101162 [Varunaivibrio sulfuroxidans]WES29868.1 LON peptidase substrate-binding domain-containing protein [Varunaivibrio sulfuroxidans]
MVKPMTFELPESLDELPESLGELPESLGLFPLPGALLIPLGQLSLNVFEPRYLHMVEDAFSRGRIIAVIQPMASHDSPPPDDVPLYTVGCAGRIVSFDETHEGTYLITLLGVHRFRLAGPARLTARGYREASVDYGAFNIDRTADPESIFTDQKDTREYLADTARVYFERRGIEADWDEMARMPLNTLVTTLAMNCPFDAREKQALLESPDPARRHALLMSLLTMANHQVGAPTNTTPARH